MKRSGHETLWLIAHALGVNHSSVYARSEFSDDEQAKIEAVIARREMGEPLQYIMGEADFFGRDFVVGEGVLIPRHDTETLIYAAMKLFAHDEKFTFIDWGTGSGCIGATLLMEFPEARGYLVEASYDAANYAMANLSRYDLADRAIILPDMTTLHECRVIISNPPYIPSGEIAGLMKTVRDYEPRSALDGGLDGLMCYRQIFREADRLMCEYIILEIGSLNQLQSLQSMSKNFTLCDKVYDDGNFPRCLVFRRSDVHETCWGNFNRSHYCYDHFQCNLCRH